MNIADLAPCLEAWDRLNMAINAFVVALPSTITKHAERLSAAHVEMARLDVPDSVTPAWGALRVSIGSALAAMPHELSAGIERLEQRREAMRAAIWDLSKQLTPAQSTAIETLAAVMAERHPKQVSRRYRR